MKNNSRNNKPVFFFPYRSIFSKKAFSLLEAITALFLFSIGVLGIISFYPVLSNSSNRALVMTEESMLIEHAISAIKMYMHEQDWDVFTWSDLNSKYASFQTLPPNPKYTFRAVSEDIGQDTYVRKFEITLRTPFNTDWREKEFIGYISK